MKGTICTTIKSFIRMTNSGSINQIKEDMRVLRGMTISWGLFLCALQLSIVPVATHNAQVAVVPQKLCT
jgi:hypothetical protein